MTNDEHISEFLKLGFPEPPTPEKLEPEEVAIIKEILRVVAANTSGTGRVKKYVLGLALDFTLLAQRLSAKDPELKKARPKLTEKELFSRYTLVTERGDTVANTLTLTFQGKEEGIRKLEERVVSLFHNLNRSGYPSAYVYNTGQWQKFKDLLVLCFRTSEFGRYVLCQELIKFGCSIIPEHTYFGRKVQRARLFETVLTAYPRSDPKENGGLVMQAIAHGFFAADRPHLSLLADKVRTGSARQKRFGDIDAYRGLDIELSVEVKDIHITKENLQREFGGFIKQAVPTNTKAIAFVASIDTDTRAELAGFGITVLTLENLKAIVDTWDWPKQDNALQAMLHHISHVEQNSEATDRLLDFVKTNDPSHDSLVYFSQETKESDI